MIQAAQNKMIDLKTLTTSGTESVDPNTLVDLETALEEEEFANQLQASLSADIGEVKPVEVSAEQLLQSPSQLLKAIPNAEAPESQGPKIFDPDLTRRVEKLVAPTTSEAAPVKLTDEQVLKLSKGEVEEVKAEVAQAMLKTPQVVKQEATPEAKLQLQQLQQLQQTQKQPQVQQAQQAQVAQPQVLQAQLQQLPQQQALSAGRAPAIDFAKTEIDPQLMNMEDFVLQKNMASKKLPAAGNAYGMNLKPQVQKEAMALDLNPSQLIGESASSETSGEAVNSQQFILNMMSEQGQPKTSETQAPVRVFDLSQVKTENANQIINQISDYIVQAKAAKEPTVNLRVSHDELGMIDITVSKSAPAPGTQDAVAINIGTHSADGKHFFQQNSKDLFSHLTQSGLNVADLRVETPAQTAKNDFDMSGQSRQGHDGADKHFGSEQNQRRHESERRQELWDLLRDKEAA